MFKCIVFCVVNKTLIELENTLLFHFYLKRNSLTFKENKTINRFPIDLTYLPHDGNKGVQSPFVSHVTVVVPSSVNPTSQANFAIVLLPSVSVVYDRPGEELISEHFATGKHSHYSLDFISVIEVTKVVLHILPNL